MYVAVQWMSPDCISLIMILAENQKANVIVRVFVYFTYTYIYTIHFSDCS